MRIAFPQMGDYWVFTNALFRKLSAGLVIPPPVSERTLSLGVKHSPETACLPFKLSLGSMIEALEMGADAIAMPGHYGPCRFGYYHKLQEAILRELGYQFRMITEDDGLPRMGARIIEGTRPPEVVRGVIVGLAKLKLLDEMPKALYRVRAREAGRGAATRIYRQAIARLDEARSYRSVRAVRRDYLAAMKRVPLDQSREVLKVGITGEIYIVLEPFSNMQIETELGKLGVEVQRTVSLWDFIGGFNPFARLFGLGERFKSQRAARPYLAHHVGGDGLQSVGEKVLHAEDWDGLVHLEPFGCLPEIMARNIMPSTREELSVLNIVFDEHTGKAGIVSRLEAFVDMIRSRKRRQRRQKAGAASAGG
ncbi:acyl-CoA dehydratase activase-related protein [Chloroflexota bacterium]